MKKFGDNDFSQQRERMVELIEREGIQDAAVLNALRLTPREAFVPPELHQSAYRNEPLPIGNEQTISQPYVVALMAAALELQLEERVLEIGAGSGYAAAVLSHLAREVYTVERHPDLAESARDRLQAEGFENVHVLCGDGTLGWPEHAPYDAIVVAAAGPRAPQPLLQQLRVGGRFVMPIGPNLRRQRLIRVDKTGDRSYRQTELGAVRFVPLIGAAGWQE